MCNDVNTDVHVTRAHCHVDSGKQRLAEKEATHKHRLKKKGREDLLRVGLNNETPRCSLTIFFEGSISEYSAQVDHAPSCRVESICDGSQAGGLKLDGL